MFLIAYSALSFSAGQKDTKSPPGPNLHTGSNCLFKWLSIFKDPRPTIFNYTANVTIGNARIKTLTKTEQKSVN